jgi:cytochrome c-type biogenesis protein CcmH/NrfG
MDQDQAAPVPAVSPGELLRHHLFDGDVLQLPAPDEGIPGFLPEWFSGPLPVLVYPPLRAQGIQEGDNVNLEVTPFHIYYGALRELAETADEARSAVLRQLVMGWNAGAAQEVGQLARRHIEHALLHCELAQELEGAPAGLAQAAEIVEAALAHLPEGSDAALGEPSDAQVAFQQAQQLLNSDPARAAELARPLAEAHPESGEVWFVLGAALRRTGDLGEAERCLRRAARLAPSEPFVWWELARALLAGGHGRPAEEAIRRALESDPEHPLYLADLGRALLAQGDREGAAEAIGKAQALVPDDPEVAEAAALLEDAA